MVTITGSMNCVDKIRVPYIVLDFGSGQTSIQSARLSCNKNIKGNQSKLSKCSDFNFHIKDENQRIIFLQLNNRKLQNKDLQILESAVWYGGKQYTK